MVEEHHGLLRATVPGLPGCAAEAPDLCHLSLAIQCEIENHIEERARRGLSIPNPIPIPGEATGDFEVVVELPQLRDGPHSRYP